jgi:hypothetical protein
MPDRGKSGQHDARVNISTSVIVETGEPSIIIR